MKSKLLIDNQENLNFFENKWKLFNKKIIDKIQEKKLINHQYNEDMYIELVDKVRIKKNQLQDLKNLMDNKIRKIQSRFDKEMDWLNYEKRNFLIRENQYQINKKSLEKIYLTKINLLDKKYKAKFKLFERNFEIYQEKIKKSSELLQKQNLAQENLYNKKIDSEVTTTLKKHEAIFNKHKNYVKNTNNYFNKYVNKINQNYIKLEAKLQKKLEAKKIGQEVYDQKLFSYELNVRKNYEKALKKHELVSTPIDFKVAKFKANTKIFGTYSDFKKADKKIFQILNANKLIIAIIIFSLVVGFINPAFFEATNWFNNIMGNNTYFGLLAIGMTFVILVGGIDLSVGSGLAFSASVMLILFNQGIPIYVAILVGIITSIACSLLMGVIVSYGKFQAFIVTLVGLLVLGGVNKVVLEGTPISVNNDFINSLGSSINGVFPISLIILIGVLLIAFITLKWTKYGRKIYATGSNSDAARVSGINVKWIVASTFLISGITVGLAGLVFISQIKSVSPTTGAGFELDAIAAVVLGGTSLTGGKGSVIRTAIGWLVISMLGNIFVFLGLDSNIQLIAKGAIILIAIFLDKELGLSNKIVNISRKISYQFKIL